MALSTTIIAAVGLIVLAGITSVTVTGILLSISLRTGGTGVQLRNIAVVLGALPGGFMLLLLGPVLPRGLRQLLIQVFPEPQIGVDATARSTTEFTLADD